MSAYVIPGLALYFPYFRIPTDLPIGWTSAGKQFLAAVVAIVGGILVVGAAERLLRLRSKLSDPTSGKAASSAADILIVGVGGSSDAFELTLIFRTGLRMHLEAHLFCEFWRAVHSGCWMGLFEAVGRNVDLRDSAT